MPLFRRTRPTLPIPSIPDGRRVYAIGDIHGRYDLLTRLLERVRADSEARGSAIVSVILLGDLIDRGPDSTSVVALAMQPLAWATLQVVMGNHEAAMLDALDGDSAMLDLWLSNGGMAALDSWGLRPHATGSWSVADILEQARRIIPGEQIDWLRDRPLSVSIGDYLFVHAGVRPGRPLDQQSPQDMLWIRDKFLRSVQYHGAMIVHGHSVVPEVEERPNRIGLDTGAYFSNRLTAMGIEGDRRWLLTT